MYDEALKIDSLSTLAYNNKGSNLYIIFFWTGWSLDNL